MQTKLNHIVRKLYKIAWRHWRIIIGLLLIVLFEIFELHYKNESFYDPFHIIELVIYIITLYLVGTLINWLEKSNTAQRNTLEILNHKHNLSLDLTKSGDWNTLATKLVMLPSTIADVSASQLGVRDTLTGRLETIATWNCAGSYYANFCMDCQASMADHLTARLVFSGCLHAPDHEGARRGLEYCLPINYANQVLAMIQFKLKSSDELSSHQKEIFESIQPEIALAIQVNQEQKRLSDLQRTQTALEERHAISNFLHDNLSQNLAYLCLKLDQIAEGDEMRTSRSMQPDLRRMKDAADQSYEIVRNMIETIHPKTTPLLNNLLSEYAAKVSQRAKFEITVKSQGEPKPILPEIQQSIFYIFQEALINIEKYAGTDRVNVILNWSEDSLAVIISDHGIGYDPNTIDENKHFGLKIMRERIEKLNGKLEISSSKNLGTTVSFTIPSLSPINQHGLPL